jgi:hypothetical protein
MPQFDPLHRRDQLFVGRRRAADLAAPRTSPTPPRCMSFPTEAQVNARAYRGQDESANRTDVRLSMTDSPMLAE